MLSDEILILIQYLNTRDIADLYYSMVEYRYYIDKYFGDFPKYYYENICSNCELQPQYNNYLCNNCININFNDSNICACCNIYRNSDELIFNNNIYQCKEKCNYACTWGTHEFNSYEYCTHFYFDNGDKYFFCSDCFNECCEDETFEDEIYLSTRYDFNTEIDLRTFMCNMCNDIIVFQSCYPDNYFLRSNDIQPEYQHINKNISNNLNTIDDRIVLCNDCYNSDYLKFLLKFNFII